MSSIFDTLDFASDFFGQPDRNKQKVSRREYRTGYIDYYDQSLDATGIKADLSRRSPTDSKEEESKQVSVNQVGVTDSGDDDPMSISNLTNLSAGFDRNLNSSSSILDLENNFIDYNTSLQNAGFKDRSDSFLNKNFGISLAAVPQSGKEAKEDVKSLASKRGLTSLLKSGAKRGLAYLGMSPIITGGATGFVTGKTLSDPLGNPSYRPDHSILGTVMDINYSIQSNNISQSMAAMNANNVTGYRGAKSPTGFFGYIGGQLVSRAPNGKSYTGVNAEYGRMAEAFSKGYAPLGYNVDSESGQHSIASRTGAFRGYDERGYHVSGNQFSKAGSMSDVRVTAETYFGKGAGREEDKKVIEALQRVRSQYTFLGNLKDGVKNPVKLSQLLAEKASTGSYDNKYTKGSDLGDAADSVGSTGDLGGATSAGYSTPSAVASASSFDDGGEHDHSPSGDSDSGLGDQGGVGGGYTAKGGFIGSKKNFALGGRGDAEPAGFIEGPPEQFSDQTTIADDIPLKVKDGTFVINAPAVENEGSPSIQKMLAEGYKKAMTRDIGVDKNFRIGKIPSKEELDIQISRGEVVVPPHVAKVIGYDKLEKINNKGKREVERRQKAGDQEKVQAGQGFAAKGGVFTIDKVADSYKEKYATPQLARQATMKLARKMPLADALAILIWGEAKNLGDEGLEGAAHVLINRANAEKYPGFGKSIYEELTRTYEGAKGERIFQFNALEPTKFRETIKKFKKDNDTYLRVRNIAEEVMAGARKDFTNNALFFYNPFTSGSDWYKEQVSKKHFKETYRTVNPKNKKALHVYHVPSDFKMDTILGAEKITPEQFKPSTPIPNEVTLPMKRPKEVEDRSDDGGFLDYLKKLF